MKLPANVLAVVAFLAIVYAVSGWVQSYLVSATAARAASCLELLGSTTVEEQGITRIAGSIRNNCGRKYLAVQVSFKLDRTDKSGLPPAFVFADGHDLAPGAIWEFRTSPVAKSTAYHVDEISGR
ncbi:MAG TPA: hypothetical protein VFL57_03765 [Bryobacteraceae bacterium]|nr:hypothetical protein [Bryobacteraceae bacterium]